MALLLPLPALCQISSGSSTKLATHKIAVGSAAQLRNDAFAELADGFDQARTEFVVKFDGPNDQQDAFDTFFADLERGLPSDVDASQGGFDQVRLVPGEIMDVQLEQQTMLDGPTKVFRLRKGSLKQKAIKTLALAIACSVFSTIACALFGGPLLANRDSEEEGDEQEFEEAAMTEGAVNDAEALKYSQDLLEQYECYDLSPDFGNAMLADDLLSEYEALSRFPMQEVEQAMVTCCQEIAWSLKAKDTEDHPAHDLELEPAF